MRSSPIGANGETQNIADRLTRLVVLIRRKNAEDKCAVRREISKGSNSPCLDVTYERITD